jgi:uncharacterized membrane protein
MHKSRLEAFSDGVIAIITIMVLELKAPHEPTLEALPVVASVPQLRAEFRLRRHLLNNHHHAAGCAARDRRHPLGQPAPAVLALRSRSAPRGSARTTSNPCPSLYGFLLLMCAIAYTILSRALIARHGPDSALARAVGRDGKGLASLAIYCCALPLAFVSPRLASALYVVVATLWLVPDRRIERNLARSPD